MKNVKNEYGWHRRLKGNLTFKVDPRAEMIRWCSCICHFVKFQIDPLISTGTVSSGPAMCGSSPFGAQKTSDVARCCYVGPTS